MPDDPFRPLTWITPVFIGRWDAPSEGGGGEEGELAPFYLFGEDGAPLLSPVDGDLMQEPA